MVFFICRKLRPAAAQIHGARIPEIFGRLEDFAFLPVVQGDFLHVVEGEFSQIYLSVLSVSQLYPVIKDSYMVGSQATDIYGFQSAYPSVVFQLYPREITYGIGYGETVETSQFFSGEFLWRDYFVLSAEYLYLFNVKNRVVRILGSETGSLKKDSLKLKSRKKF